MELPDQANGIVLWLFGAAGSIVASAVGLLWKRIEGVRREMEGDMLEFRQAIGERLKDGKADRERLWKEVKDNQNRMDDAHRKMLRELARLPTREEMRQDMASMKSDIAQLVRDGASRQH